MIGRLLLRDPDEPSPSTTVVTQLPNPWCLSRLPGTHTHVLLLTRDVLHVGGLDLCCGGTHTHGKAEGTPGTWDLCCKEGMARHFLEADELISGRQWWGVL